MLEQAKALEKSLTEHTNALNSVETRLRRRVWWNSLIATVALLTGILSGIGWWQSRDAIHKVKVEAVARNQVACETGNDSRLALLGLFDFLDEQAPKPHSPEFQHLIDFGTKQFAVRNCLSPVSNDK